MLCGQTLRSHWNVVFGSVSTGVHPNPVIKITSNNAFHTKSCTIKSFKSWGRLSVELLILLSCHRTLLSNFSKKKKMGERGVIISLFW